MLSCEGQLDLGYWAPSTKGYEQYYDNPKALSSFQTPQGRRGRWSHLVAGPGSTCGSSDVRRRWPVARPLPEVGKVALTGLNDQPGVRER